MWEEWKHKIKNEDEYVEKLTDVSDLIINMTDFTDEELINIRDSIERELRFYCYSRPWILARLIKEYYEWWGFKHTVKGVLKKVYSLLPFTKVLHPNHLRRNSENNNLKNVEIAATINELKFIY